jgi:hypothetical protein
MVTLLKKTLKAKVQIALVYTLVGFYMSCDYPINPNHRLTFLRTPYNGNELRMDGVYKFVRISEGQKFFRFSFFYRNGVRRHGGANIDSTYFAKNGWGFDDARFLWGLFKIHGETIEYETWTPFDTYIHLGTILNDTTFLIQKVRASNSSEWRLKEELYRFVKYSPKPDSVTRFID